MCTQIKDKITIDILNQFHDRITNLEKDLEVFRKVSESDNDRMYELIQKVQEQVERIMKLNTCYDSYIKGGY